MVRKLDKNEQAYKNLKVACAMLEALSPRNVEYKIKDVYFDFGQDWKWTTIVTDRCQILCPRDWEGITDALTMEDIAYWVREVRDDEYFKDK